MLRNLALAAVAIAVALLAAELLYRGYEVAFPPQAPEAVVLDPELAALPELNGLLALARPGTRGRFMNVLWRTNSAGMRGAEVAPRAPEDSFRIALIGDSFVAGVGVAEANIYAAQLERLLAASGTGVGFEVLNFGMPGLNAPAVVERAGRLAPRFQPRLYVYGFTLNDIFAPREEASAHEPFDFASLQELAARVQGLRSHLVAALIPRVLSLTAILRPGPYTQLVQRTYADPQRQARLRRSFEALSALAGRSGTCAHVFVHTDLAALRFGHPFREVYAEIADVAHAAGIGASSSFEAFRGRDSARLRLGALDGHPNAEGHRILAESLYDALRDLPPSCGMPPIPARGEG